MTATEHPANAHGVRARVVLALACALGGLLLTAASALAVAPETPEAGTASAVTATTATLSGILNPKGGTEGGTYEFLYKASATECVGGSTTTQGLVLGLAQPVTEGISGLAPHTTYTFCLLDRNEANETRTGPPLTFTTTAPPEAPETLSASAVTTTSATLHGVLNPKGEGETGTYEFLYQASATECAAGSPTPQGAVLGTTQPVSAEVTGLSPGATYTFCLLDRNGAGEVTLGPPVTFTAEALPPTIGSEYVTEASATGATLNAEIDPGGAQTTYHFQYGTSVAYGQSTNDASLGASDNSEHTAKVQLEELQPGTVYHYRVVVSSSRSGPGGVVGPDQTFTTQIVGEGFLLPDGRQYELVSPPHKNGAEVLGIGGGGETPANGDATQASEDGSSVTYITNAPVNTNPPGSNGTTQLLSTRGAGGWTTQDISRPNTHPASYRLEQGEEYESFSADLSRAVLEPNLNPQPSLAPEIHQEVKAFQEVFIRNDLTGTFQALDTVEPLPVRSASTPPTYAAAAVRFEGGSPDLSHVVFHGPPGLDARYATDAEGDLYEWVDGQVQLVDLLPGNASAPQGTLGGGEQEQFPYSLHHAVSNDGTRVVWGDGAGVFTRDMTTGETVMVSPEGSPEAGFLDASSDGLRVFYEASPGGGISMFDVTDRTRTSLGAGSSDFLGANEAGTALYIISPEVLSSAPNSEGEAAQTGAPNVYVLREAPLGSGSWSATFIAAGLEEGSREGSNGRTPLAKQSERVSPNGRYLAFMSQQRLTGYDNSDASSGAPDEEVYLYDAEANRLTCPSCDSTGARPTGSYDTEEKFFGTPLDPWKEWEGRWLAASIQGWTPNGGELSTRYQPRYLSDSGRLFFDSADALVPQDVNGEVDVYEYEPEGVGSCQAPGYGQSASDVLSKAAGGCVGLISSGTGSAASTFFDASASGSVVFFTTQDDLVAQDKDGASDLYAARICTSAEPCPPQFAVAPPCSTTDSCRAAPAPQPGVFGEPASASFYGAGNAPTPLAPEQTGKPKANKRTGTRAEKLAGALRACKKRPKDKRAGCKARARKRYGAKVTSKIKSGRRSK